MEQYIVGTALSEGCFGTVYAARHRTTGAAVALKRVPVSRVGEGLPSAICREVGALLRLRGHLFVTHLYECFGHGSAIIFVLELCVGDLASLLRLNGLPSASRLLPADAKGYLMMVLGGLEQCHGSGILHRDVKPGNFLLGASGHLKLADFGLARPADLPDDDDLFTHEVATRWYRAPELLLGARRYGAAVDLWAAGCIAVELLCGFNSAIFQGVGDIDQLNKIFHVLGTPNGVDVWPLVADTPDWGKIEFVPQQGLGLAAAFPELSGSALDLVSRLIVLDPKDRLSARDALSHPYFVDEPPPSPPHVLADVARSLLAASRPAPIPTVQEIFAAENV